MFSLMYDTFFAKYEINIENQYVPIFSQMNCIMKTSIPGNNDTLQYVSPLQNQSRNPNETSKCTFRVWFWMFYLCQYLPCRKLNYCDNRGKMVEGGIEKEGKEGEVEPPYPQNCSIVNNFSK